MDDNLIHVYSPEQAVAMNSIVLFLILDPKSKNFVKHK